MDGKKPLVSVCLPVYNGANFLAQAIESVLAQSFSDFELLIADDCSTDETLTIIKNFAAKDTRIKFWTNEQNLKLFGNYNACMNRAEGVYIKPFAHDDLFKNDALQKMVAILETHPDVSLVSCARGWIDENGAKIEPASVQETKVLKPFTGDKQISCAEAISGTLKEVLNWLGEPCSQMFRKEHMGTGFDSSFKQIGDLEYSYRLLQHGDYFFLGEELCSFRKHTQSWSAARALELTARLDWFVLAARYKSFIKLTGMSGEEYLLFLLRETATNFEYELCETGRFSSSTGSETLEAGQLEAVFKELANSEIFSYFEGVESGKRDALKELQGLGLTGFLQCVLLERKLRYIEKERKREALSNIAVIQESKDEQSLEIQELHRTLELQQKEIEEMRLLLARMGNSASWKITAPLRIFREKFQ